MPSIACLPNGPYYLIFGNEPYTIPYLHKADGGTCTKVDAAALCRCGGSKTKPLCDDRRHRAHRCRLRGRCLERALHVMPLRRLEEQAVLRRLALGHQFYRWLKNVSGTISGKLCLTHFSLETGSIICRRVPRSPG